MKRLLVMLATLCIVLGCGIKHDKKQARKRFKVDVILKTTPVKNQGRSSLCWIYGMLATIETEHLMRGDSVNLSAEYAARISLINRAQDYYLSHANTRLNQRGMASELLHTINRHGLLAYDTYNTPSADVFNALERKMKNACRLAIANREGIEKLNTRLSQLADQSIGFLPKAQFMLGAEYTLPEFARSVCRQDEYEALTSFTHHAFYSRFVLETPDNYLRDTFLNLPVDSLTNIVERSIRNNHPVCWEGDITEPGFVFERGIAVLKDNNLPVTQQKRQREFETFRTTDDHCMAIVGLAHNRRGEKFFICKNSWGTNNPYNGFIFMSMDYFRLKTIAVWVQRDLIEN